jgi:hypothetical protein
MLWGEGKSLAPAGNQTPAVAHRYTDCAVIIIIIIIIITTIITVTTITGAGIGQSV